MKHVYTTCISKYKCFYAYMYTYVYMYACTYCLYMYTYIHTCTCMYMYMYVFMYTVCCLFYEFLLQLVLKHRVNKNHRTRIVAFVASPIMDDPKEAS